MLVSGGDDPDQSTACAQREHDGDLALMIGDTQCEVARLLSAGDKYVSSYSTPG